MHSLAIGTLAVGVFFGWTWKRCHVAIQDVASAVARLKGARKVRFREVGVSLVVLVIAALVVRVLAKGTI
jgi:hypothetical protein